MRPIPRFWARHRETVTFHGGTTWDMTMTGWSSVSEEDAQRMARERLARLVASGGPDGETPHDWYYPARHLPEQLLEEVHGDGGDLIAAVTRNRYGAAILNTDAVLITDVDLPAARAPRWGRAGRGSTRGGGLLSRLFGGRSPGRTEPAEPGPGQPSPSGDEARIQQASARITGVIDAFAQRNPDLGVRTYRTRNGFRVLITGADAPPNSDRAAAIMHELSSDDLYMTLCRVQESYRARLSPKPWRIHMPRPTVEEPGFGGIGIDAQWIRAYESASQQYAVCRLVSATGPAPSADEQRVIDLHDEATGPLSELPLA